PSVQDDERGERREAIQETSEARFLPLMLDVREQSGNEHQIDRSLTEHLERDVDIAVLRVADLRNVHGAHYPAISQWGRPRRSAAVLSQPGLDDRLREVPAVLQRLRLLGFP